MKTICFDCIHAGVCARWQIIDNIRRDTSESVAKLNVTGLHIEVNVIACPDFLTGTLKDVE